MSAREKLSRFARKPLPEKLAALRAKYRSIKEQLAAEWRQAWYSALSDRNLRRQIFRDIYKNKRWGSDERSKFFSGVGSRGQAAETYVEGITGLLKAHISELGRPLTVIDLGCGDFQIGRALVAGLPEITYVGCDIVPELLEHNNKIYADERVSFRQLDIVSDPLPGGDVCLVRQVLQHLSNADISNFLRRVNYKYLYVTEGHPTVRTGPFNPDIRRGADVRFNWRTGCGRGVELDKPPFGVATQEVLRAHASPNEIIITERVLSPALART
jgi:SAM-dependent methyltransferase